MGLSVSAFVLPLPGSFSFSTSVNSGRSRVFAPSAPTALHMSKEFSFFTDKNVRLFKAAQKCADDESCTLEEAEQYMNQMMGVEFACGAGLYNGECCYIEWTQEIENDLVRKIEPLEPVRRFREEIESDLVSQNFQHGGLVVGDEAPIPITAQEWAWAIQGGYIDDMLTHYLKRGGL